MPFAARTNPWRPVAAMTSTALVAGTLVGCAANSRFANGHEDPLGAPVALDAARASDPAPTPTPPVVAPRSEVPDVAINRVPSAWAPRAPERPWRYIVIHHSATHAGGAQAFDDLHRGKGWDELGYHFVVGNGTDTPDGAVEVGTRWAKQKHGAHAKTADNRFNELGIGICLVGNFDDASPSRRQMHALTVLTGHLMREYGIPASRVIGHGDTKPTACPGEHLHAEMASLRLAASRYAAATTPPAVHASAR